MTSWKEINFPRISMSNLIDEVLIETELIHLVASEELVHIACSTYFFPFVGMNLSGFNIASLLIFIFIWLALI